MPLRLRPLPNERGLTFGLTWSAVGCALTLIGLTSCGYLIPEDTRPPRYNSVVGERRSPPMNAMVGANMPNTETGEYPAAPTSVPVTANGVPIAPAASGGASSPAPAPTASVVAPNGVAPVAGARRPSGAQRSFWDKSKGWIFGDDAEIRETPVPLGAPLPPGASNTPAKKEKTIDLAMGSSSEYPKLEEVKDVPPASVQAKSKLQQAEEALKIDHARASGTRDDLAREAVSEPTLMEQYQQGKLPPAPQAQPLAAQAAPVQQTSQVEVNLPDTAPAAAVSAAAPAPGAAVTSSPIGTAPVPQATQPSDAAPATHGELEPINLVAPESVEMPPPPPTVNVVRGVQSETVEIRQPAAESGRGYLPESRYEMRTNTTN